MKKEDQVYCLNNSILIYFNEVLGSVFDSQVIELLNGIYQTFMFDDVILFLGLKNNIHRSDFLDKYKHLKFKVVFFKSYPNYPVFNTLCKLSIKNNLKKNNLLRENIIYHCRGEKISAFLCDILRKMNLNRNLIADIRGAGIEEIKEYFKGNHVIRKLKIWSFRKYMLKIKNIKKISVVSEYLKCYLTERFSFNENHISIIPCLAGESFIFNVGARKKIRQELNLNENEILFVFSSGSVAGWQNISEIKKIAEKGYKILNLSRKSIENHNIINKFVHYSKVPEFLSAADIAIIWRDENIVNNVASPVKFSEYICCGLPVIANKSVMLIKDFICKNKSGLLIEKLEELKESEIYDLLKLKRDNISKKGIEEFGFYTIIQRYSRLYESAC